MVQLWMIAGPTASGKSALALRIAEATGGEIVNADALQLYADLRILSARPPPEDEAKAPHHLFGVADAAEGWSAGRWLRAATQALDGIRRRSRPAVVVGGTGLYFRALTHGLADLPPIPAHVRAAAQESYDRLGEEAFRSELRARDPEAEARIAPGDRQRLTRALEVHEGTGRPLSTWQADAGPGPKLGDWRAVVLEPPRAQLYARCDARLAAMIQAGAVEEVRALVARGLDPALPAMKAVGARELAAFIRSETSLEEAIALAQLQTRRYAKRQLTWFRNQTPDWHRIHALEPEAQWREWRGLHGG